MQKVNVGTQIPRLLKSFVRSANRPLVVGLLLLMAASAQAFYIGPVIGMRSDTIESTPDISDGAKSNTHIGALLWIGLDMISLRTGLIATDRTFNFKQTINGVEHKGRQDIKYFDIPANLQVDLPGFPLYFFGGVIIGVKQADQCVVDTPAGSSCDLKLRNHNNVMNLGAGFDIIDVSVAKLAIEGQYEKGLTNLKTVEGDSLITQSFVLQALARFGF